MHDFVLLQRKWQTIKRAMPSPKQKWVQLAGHQGMLLFDYLVSPALLLLIPFPETYAHGNIKGGISFT